MNIVVNTRLLLKGKLEGIGWVTYELLKRITQSHPEHQFFFLFDRPYNKEFIFAENVTPVVLFPPTRHWFLQIWFFEWSVRRTLKKLRADVFVSPDGYLSLGSDVPSIAVIHDLNFEHHPGWMRKSVALYYRYFFPKFAEKAKRIVAVSHFTKSDVVQTYGIDASKIAVVHNAFGASYMPLNQQKQQEVREKYTGGSPFFVFVGSIHPRKNLENLFYAFDLFKQKDKRGVKLLVVGGKMLWRGAIEKAYQNMQYNGDVVFTGYLNDEDLSQVVASACASVYVSFFEGFGIPILEGFAAETAVITSNTTSMPEVAGDAALLVDPYSVTEIQEALTKISENPTMRETLIAEGRKQKEKFSWDYSAIRFWAVIEQELKTIEQEKASRNKDTRKK